MKERRRYGLLLLLLLAPLLCVAIFCSAQVGLLLVRPDRLDVVIGPRSTADYSKWAYVVFHRVDPVLGTAAAVDRGAPTPPAVAQAPTRTPTNRPPGPIPPTGTPLAPATQSTQPTVIPLTLSVSPVSPTVLASPSVTGSATDAGTATLTATIVSTPAATITLTATLTPLSSDTPESTLTPTDTALPSPTGTPPQPITATFGPSFTPTWTRTPSLTPPPSATLRPTRTLAPSATPIVVVILPTTPPPPIPPTATAIPPTAVPPSATPIPSSATPIPPSATPIPSSATPIPPTPTFIFTPSDTPIPPTPTFTFTPSDTPTFTPTPTDTPPICGGATPSGEPNVGPPNGIYYYVPCNGAVTVDLGAANPLTPGNFLVYYEALDVNPTNIALDQVIVEVGTTPGGPWTQVFNWGDNILDSNTNLGQQGIGGPSGEPDNYIIAATNPPLYGSSPYITGITIDVYAVAAPATYRYVRIREPSGMGNVSVDAVQVVPNVLQNLKLSPQCSPDPAAYRVWKVLNTNPGPLAFTWQLYGSSQSGSGVVPAAVGATPGVVTFTSVTEAGPNTMNLFVSGALQDTKASNPSVCAPSPTPNPSMTDTPTSTVVASADLGITQVANPPAPSQGSAFNYLLTLTNYGPADANGIQVSDLLPAGVTFASAAPSQGSYDSASGLWDVGGLTVGTSATLQLSVTLNSGTLGQTITNTANIAGAAETDSNSSNNVSTLSFLVLSSPSSQRRSPTPSASPTNIQKLPITTITPASQRRIVTPTWTPTPQKPLITTVTPASQRRIVTPTWTPTPLPNPTPHLPTVTPVPTSPTLAPSAMPTRISTSAPPTSTPTPSASATSANVTKGALPATFTHVPTKASPTPRPPTLPPTFTPTPTATATLTATFPPPTATFTLTPTFTATWTAMP